MDDDVIYEIEQKLPTYLFVVTLTYLVSCLVLYLVGMAVETVLVHPILNGFKAISV